MTDYDLEMLDRVRSKVTDEEYEWLFGFLQRVEHTGKVLQLQHDMRQLAHTTRCECVDDRSLVERTMDFVFGG